MKRLVANEAVCFFDVTSVGMKDFPEAETKLKKWVMTKRRLLIKCNFILFVIVLPEKLTVRTWGIQIEKAELQPQAPVYPVSLFDFCYFSGCAKMWISPLGINKQFPQRRILLYLNPFEICSFHLIPSFSLI